MKEVLIINILMFVASLIFFGLSLWTLVSGSIFKDKADGFFWFLATLVLAITLMINPILLWRKGIIGDLVKSRRSGERTAEEARAGSWTEDQVARPEPTHIGLEQTK